MPLTDKGDKIKSAMTKEYGDKKGEKVFYASKNKGTISGVDEGEGGGEKGSEIAAWAGLMSDGETMSDEDVEAAMDRFDTLRDKMHALDRRYDACCTMDHPEMTKKDDDCADEDKSEDLSKLKKGYGSAFQTVPNK